MRASKGYVAGVGTTGALVGAIGCAFAVLSTVVAVQGWPLSLTAPSVATLEERAPSAGKAFPSLLDVFPTAVAARTLAPAAGPTTPTSRVLRAGRVPSDGGPLASAFAPAAGGRQPSVAGTGRVPTAGPGASAASPVPVPGAGGGSAPSPVQPGAGGSGSGTVGASPSTPPASGAGSSPSLGGTVTQVTSGAGTVVSQTGQQLSGTVQGATGQLGGVVGQVSPAAGQAVTQTGQVVGGVVNGTTGAAGQVVSGAGATVGRLLGGLGRTRSG
ncbi:MAG TPA: hypothetical protein VGO48_01735 [Conexibacter sp.]|jgi:hypothetical protein|nr:hypothetical protein [Conexibacter sp.]